MLPKENLPDITITLESELFFAPILATIHSNSGSPTIWNTVNYEELLKQPHTSSYIALINKTPQGFLLFSKTADEAEIIMLAVAKQFHRKGIAQSMIKALIKNLRTLDVTDLFLEVAENNKPALRLYNQCGFYQAGLRPRYYKLSDGNKIDGLIMKKITSPLA